MWNRKEEKKAQSSQESEENDSLIGLNGIGSQKPGGLSLSYQGDPGINVSDGVALDLDGHLRVGGFEI